ncbi:hypothetical protein RB195_004677 [Necator americanus]|uniref:Uncharacterized protein n=1 Tax=Necator americanus TaxID=51031 RepID=A0ABR1BNK0_NECAM
MTSSTSLMELENILDDNSEGRKRVEDVLGPTCSVKTGHLSIQDLPDQLDPEWASLSGAQVERVQEQKQKS